MPNKQVSSAEGRRAAQGSMRGQTSGTTLEADENYALISVLYHALQGAETCGFYIEDARKAGDQALSAFFEETRAEQVERGRRAKELLAERLDGMPSERDDDEEGDIEDDRDEDDDDDDE
jgi:hypothetical protein